MKYDYSAIYNKNAEFLSVRPNAKKAVLLCNALPYFFALAYMLLWLYGVFEGEFEPLDFVKIFCAPALALVLVSVLRIAIGRPRPYEEDGAGIIPLKNKESVQNSFPSRHLTSAAVIAAVTLPYLPAVGGLLFVLTVILGYARFSLGWHYPSDLFAGVALGLIIGLAPMFL